MDLITLGASLINKLIPDPKQKAEAQAKLIELEQQGELAGLKSRYQAIVAEAQSKDRWTSRARPSFMYVFYFVIVCLVIVAPVIGVWYPAEMTLFYTNVKAGFAAIPNPMWATFTAGYLGYTTAREVGKKNIMKAMQGERL